LEDTQVHPDEPVYLSAEQIMALAWKRFQENLYIDVDKLCQKIVEKQARHHHAWYLRGLAAQARNEHAMALTFFDQAQGASELIFPLSFARGRSNLELGKIDDAIRQLKRALTLKADDAASHYWLGVAWLAKGDQKEARKELRRATLLDDNLGLAFADLGAVCLALGQTADAIAALESARRLLPDVAPVHNNLAIAYQTDNRAEAAEQSFLLAIACQEDYAEAHFGLASLLNSQNRPEEGAAHLRRALELAPHLAAQTSEAE